MHSDKVSYATLNFQWLQTEMQQAFAKLFIADEAFEIAFMEKLFGSKTCSCSKAICQAFVKKIFISDNSPEANNFSG